MIYPTSVKRKQTVPSLNHRLKVQPRSEVNSREINKQDKYYLPEQTSLVFITPNYKIFWKDRGLAYPKQ